ncbi:N-carbamoyl-D-amino-acid hydrolase [Bordetella genomosp. 10]|uniref:N-carbamoyl-D-amino-acid hydrolase n=1 Tax=Bordetella genomosp. 10 TaxID=1416804 RepID=A0A261S0T3_9BORD|nr:N-carbamoyl-D-amino-acid hydrolase [Bordetella genomosp. 10]OZI30954.1 N-carbamoyl-D-amino-acid hydrolase [Bordetella genomosp. 10]
MTSARKMGLAVAQMGPVNSTDSRAGTLKRLLDMLREAKGRGAELAVFPELAFTTFFPRYWMDQSEAVARYFEAAMPNPDVQPLFDEARKLGIGFHIGYAEATPDGHFFNTAILVDKHAHIVGKYRKVHLPGHADHRPSYPFQHLEKKYFEVGDLGFKTWDFLNTRVGMCICNDRRWPETYRVMGLQGAELVMLGYNTPSRNNSYHEAPHLPDFHHLLSIQAGAYQNAMWVAAAGKVGYEDGIHMIGGSAIVAPDGEIVAKAAGDTDDEVIFFNVDFARCDGPREYMFNFAKHRRTEHYGLIVEQTGMAERIA